MDGEYRGQRPSLNSWRGYNVEMMRLRRQPSQAGKHDSDWKILGQAMLMVGPTLVVLTMIFAVPWMLAIQERGSVFQPGQELMGMELPRWMNFSAAEAFTESRADALQAELERALANIEMVEEKAKAAEAKAKANEAKTEAAEARARAAEARMKAADAKAEEALAKAKEAEAEKKALAFGAAESVKNAEALARAKAEEAESKATSAEAKAEAAESAAKAAEEKARAAVEQGREAEAAARLAKANAAAAEVKAKAAEAEVKKVKAQKMQVHSELIHTRALAKSEAARAALAAKKAAALAAASASAAAAGVPKALPAQAAGATDVSTGGGGEGEKDHEKRASAFTDIYKYGKWNSRESKSGGGSEMGFTKNIRFFLGVVFKALKIKSLLDSPCGDCHWQPNIPDFANLSYVGVDIVPSVIEGNKAKYASKSNMNFFNIDLASQTLPPGPFDAVLCRDMVQHLPLKAGLAAYRALEKSGAKYLLTSFHSQCAGNADIEAGGCRFIDLMQPPFNFSKPLIYAMEGIDVCMNPREKEHYKMVGLWKLPALGRGDGRSFLPINQEALKGKFVILDKSFALQLEAVGFDDYVCHSKETCDGDDDGNDVSKGADAASTLAGADVSKEGGSDEQGRERLARESVFAEEYRKRQLARRGGSMAGDGSGFGYTVNIRRFLGVVARTLKVKSLLDSPSGDCSWQPFIPGFDNLTYTGVDIVKRIVDGNKAKYALHRNMKFFNLDMVSQPLPPGPFDAVLCRDMVQHLPLKDGVAAYEAIEKTGAKFLLTSFHSKCDGNKDITTGGCRFIDLMQPPFNFSKPLMYASEGIDVCVSPRETQHFKMIGLWRLPALGKGDGQTFLPIDSNVLRKGFAVFSGKELIT